MKIYFIGQKGIPTKYGGVERHAEELSTRLVQAGHEVYVYTRPNYTDTRLKTFRGVKLISLPAVATKRLDTISHVFRACLDLRKRQVDLIHFHSIGPSSLIWLVKLLKPGVPVVATFHTKCYEHKKWGVIARWYLKFGETSCCKLADKTIVVSLSLLRYARNKYGRAAIYIPNGVTAAKATADGLVKDLGLAAGGYFLAVSRLVRHKGLHYLIEAYNKLATDKKLVIVGDGVYTDDYVSALKQLAAGNKNIIFTGARSGQDLAALFANAHLFIQPSESEGLSIALLEAMAYGRPVLASDIPENLEAMGGCGFSFKSQDVNDLRKQIEYLLKNDPLLFKKGEAGKLRAQKKYNWNNITDKTIAVYESAAAMKGRGKFIFKSQEVV